MCLQPYQTANSMRSIINDQKQLIECFFNWTHLSIHSRSIYRLIRFLYLRKWSESFSLSCTGEGNGNPLQCSCWRIPGTEKPSVLPSMGLHRVGHDWGNWAAAAEKEKISLVCFLLLLKRDKNVWHLQPISSVWRPLAFLPVTLSWHSIAHSW